MTYKINISITLRPSILDPQGKAAQHALHELKFSNVSQVRMGKYVEMWVEAADEKEARKSAELACEKLLANPVMEDYFISAVEETAVV